MGLYYYSELLSLGFKWMLVTPTQTLTLAWQALYSTELSLQPLVGFRCRSQRVAFCLQGSLCRAMSFIRAEADAGTEVDMG